MEQGITVASSLRTHPSRDAVFAGTVSPSPTGARLTLVFVVAAAVAVGFLSTPSASASEAVAAAGRDLTRLLRGMAALKAVLALGVTVPLGWRLGAPVTLARLAVYAGAAAAMWAGPGLIWDMFFVRTGAFLLHAGLLVTLVALWRDPVTAERLACLLRARSSKRSP